MAGESSTLIAEAKDGLEAGFETFVLISGNPTWLKVTKVSHYESQSADLVRLELVTGRQIITRKEALLAVQMGEE